LISAHRDVGERSGASEREATSYAAIADRRAAGRVIGRVDREVIRVACASPGAALRQRLAGQRTRRLIELVAGV
jgi:hypothetical protein